MKLGFKRGLSLLLVMMMVVSLMPISVLAKTSEEVIASDENQELEVNQGPEAAAEIQSEREGDYKYTDYKDGVSIVYYDGNERNLRIPSTLGGKKVVDIDGDAFRSNQNLEIVTIPDSVKTIRGSEQSPHGAFLDCKNLKTVDLGDGLVELGNSTFHGCKNLTTVLFGENLQKIGPYAFKWNEKLDLRTLPQSVTDLGDSAFEGCHAIKEMEIPAGIVNISHGAFYSCEGLETIKFPEGLKSIGDLAFAECRRLKTVTIPDSVEAIDTRAFNWCEGLQEVEIGSGVTELKADAFSYCRSLKKAFIGENVTTIHRKAFAGSTDSLTIYGVAGSSAETHARELWVPFVEWPAKDLRVNDFTTNKEPDQKVNTEIVLAANGLGGQAPYTYKFYYQLGETITVIQDYSAREEVSFKPLEAGTYTLFVEVKDSQGKTATKSIKDFQIVEEGDKNPATRYRTHIQNKDWQEFKNDGQESGTLGESLRLEGIEIELDQGDYDLGVDYRTHVENEGWQGFKSNGEMSGTSGQSLRLEAIEIKLSGADAKKFDIYYQTHVQNYGWLDWAKNGQKSGSEGYGYRLEAIKILILPQGTLPPDSQTDKKAFYSIFPQ